MAHLNKTSPLLAFRSPHAARDGDEAAMGVVDRQRATRVTPAADAAAVRGASAVTADAVLYLPGWCDGQGGALSAQGADALMRLRRDILSGCLAADAPLPLKVLAAEYDVGLVPLREALTLLCGAGLVVQESPRGFRVAPASRADLVDVAQCRRRLETMALALSIRRGDALWRRQVGRTRRAFAEVAAHESDQGPIDEISGGSAQPLPFRVDLGLRLGGAAGVLRAAPRPLRPLSAVGAAIEGDHGRHIRRSRHHRRRGADRRRLPRGGAARPAHRGNGRVGARQLRGARRLDPRQRHTSSHSLRTASLARARRACPRTRCGRGP